MHPVHQQARSSSSVGIEGAIFSTAIQHLNLARQHGEVRLLDDPQPLQQVRQRPSIHELHDHNNAAALEVRLRQVRASIVQFARVQCSCGCSLHHVECPNTMGRLLSFAVPSQTIVFHRRQQTIVEAVKMRAHLVVAHDEGVVGVVQRAQLGCDLLAHHIVADVELHDLEAHDGHRLRKLRKLQGVVSCSSLPRLAGGQQHFCCYSVHAAERPCSID